MSEVALRRRDVGIAYERDAMESRRNIGVDLLKIAACIGVVLMHFGGCGSRYLKPSVPIFMFVAIYLSGKVLDSGDWRLLASRLRRLLIPFFVWGFVYLTISFIIKRTVIVMDVVYQFFFGSAVCPVLYFLVLLCFYSVILFVGTKLCNSRRMLILIGGGGGGFVLSAAIYGVE